jgi:protocatechuate 3,4-dioxygenase beta subunit
MIVSRRAFLRYATAGGAATAMAAACGGTDAEGDLDAAPSDGIDPDATACRATTADVLGPFHQPGAPLRMVLADANEPGERLVVTGSVVDTACAPIAGVLLDVWQADRDGAYHGGTVDQYRLRGRMTTGAGGGFRIETIRPGNYQQAAGLWRPAHLHFTISHQTHRPVTTQVYFAGDPYLPPNDSCTTCTSDDPDRVMALTGSAAAGWAGDLRFVLR